MDYGEQGEFLSCVLSLFNIFLLWFYMSNKWVLLPARAHKFKCRPMQFGTLILFNFRPAMHLKGSRSVLYAYNQNMACVFLKIFQENRRNSQRNHQTLKLPRNSLNRTRLVFIKGTDNISGERGNSMT